MKRVIGIISVLLLLCCTACGGTAYDNSHADVTVNMPEDDLVNGYRTGSRSSKNSGMPDTVEAGAVTPGQSGGETDSKTAVFVGNKNSHVFHKPSCASAAKIKEENRISFSSRDDAVNKGYTPCGRCEP